MSRHETSSQAADSQKRLAVLIDADNAQPTVIAALLAEIAKHGIAGVKRIYGDWTSTRHAQWKAQLLEHSIAPIQQFAYTSGKNATDSALIIDAMDLMYSGRFDGFCVVSSDSDFTRLAQRLREAGMAVYGFGERKTPKPFVAACDKFVYTEVLRVDSATMEASFDVQPRAAPARAVETTPASDVPSGQSPAPAPATDVDAMVRLISRAIEEEADDSGWAFLGAVGNYLTKIQPDFDPRLYGFRKLSEIVRKHSDKFETSERGPAGSPSKAVYARLTGKGSPSKSRN